MKKRDPSLAEGWDLCNAVISTLFSVSYLVLEFQTSGTKVSHNCDFP